MQSTSIENENKSISTKIFIAETLVIYKKTHGESFSNNVYSNIIFHFNIKRILSIQ
jgi:hypothetical protein